MIKKTRIVLLYMFFSFLLMSIPVKAKPTLMILPDRDTYIGDQNPDLNYGVYTTLWVLHDGWEICHALIYFELPDSFDQYWFVKLHFYTFLSENGYFRLDIYRVIEQWDELTVTWNSRPELGDFLVTYTINYDQEIYIDIRPYVNSQVFSICILNPLTLYNLAQIPSREARTTEIERTYIELSDLDPFIVSLIAIFAFIGLIAIGLVLFFHRRLKK